MILVSINFITSLMLWLFGGGALLESKYGWLQRMSFNEEAMLVLIWKVLYKLLMMQLHSSSNLSFWVLESCDSSLKFRTIVSMRDLIYLMSVWRIASLLRTC